MRRLDNWLEAYMAYNENSEPPKLYHKWVAVSVVAAALRRKVHLQWGTLTFYPNFYVVLVGPPGKCRKGTAMGPGYDLLRQVGIPMAAESITREALIRELKSVSDSQVNPAGGTISMHSSLTIFSPELTVFLGYNNHQLMSDLTDWFDCRERWTYRTKNMGTDDITGVFVNLIGATTPDLIQSTLPIDAIGGGLTSRMIFVYAEKKYKTVPFPFVTPEMVTIKQHLVMDLEQISMMQGVFRATSAFSSLWDTWYRAQEDNPPFDDPRLAAYIERRPTHILKLSIIMSVFRDKKMEFILHECDLLNAIALLEETEKEMGKTFGGVGKAQHADLASKLLAYLGNNGEVPRSTLMNYFIRDIDISGLDMLLGTLEASRAIKRRITAEDTYVRLVYKADGSHLLHSNFEDSDGGTN